MFGSTDRQIELILAQQKLLLTQTTFLEKQTTSVLDEFKDVLQIMKLMAKEISEQNQRLEVALSSIVKLERMVFPTDIEIPETLKPLPMTQKDIDSCKGITDKLKAAKIHSGPGSVA